MTDSTKFAVEVAEALGWHKVVFGDCDFIRPCIMLDVGGVPSRAYSRHSSIALGFRPNANANDDYDVLVEARKWTIGKQVMFCTALELIYSERNKTPHVWLLDYYIGDYARAVLVVVEEEKSNEQAN